MSRPRDGDPPRPPSGRWRRFVPMAATVVLIWLRWRWLRLKRRLLRSELPEATERFHLAAARAMVRRSIRQQGLIIKAMQFLGSRADILREEYVETLSLLHDAVPPRPWEELRPLVEAGAGRTRRGAVRRVRHGGRRRRLAGAGPSREAARRHGCRRQGAIPRHRADRALGPRDDRLADGDLGAHRDGDRLPPDRRRDAAQRARRDRLRARGPRRRGNSDADRRPRGRGRPAHLLGALQPPRADDGLPRRHQDHERRGAATRRASTRGR